MYRNNIPAQPRGVSTQSRDSYHSSFQPQTVQLSGRRESKRIYTQPVGNLSVQEYGINPRSSFKENRPPSITFNKQQSTNQNQMRSPSLYEVKVPSIKSILGYKPQNIRNIVDSSQQLMNRQENERAHRKDVIRNSEKYTYVLSKNCMEKTEQQKKMPKCQMSHGGSNIVAHDLTLSHQSFDRGDTINKSMESFSLQQQVRNLNQRIRTLQEKTQKQFMKKQQFQKRFIDFELLKAHQIQKLPRHDIDIENNKNAIQRIKDDINNMVQFKDFNEALDEIKRQFNKNNSIYKRGSIKFSSASYQSFDASLDMDNSASISKKILKIQEDLIENRRNIDKLFTEIQSSSLSCKLDTIGSSHPLAFLVELSLSKLSSYLSDHLNHQLTRSYSSSNHQVYSNHRMSFSSTFSKQNTPEFTYYIDSEGFLLDSNKKYLINNRNKLIRLQDSEITLLKQQNLFEK